MKRKKNSYTTCKCGHITSIAGSSSSGSKSSVCGGNVRKRLTFTIWTISGISASVNIFCPAGVFTYSASSTKVSRFNSLPRVSESASSKSNNIQQSWSFCLNNACEYGMLTPCMGQRSVAKVKHILRIFTSLFNIGVSERSGNSFTTCILCARVIDDRLILNWRKKMSLQ